MGERNGGVHDAMGRIAGLAVVDVVGTALLAWACDRATLTGGGAWPLWFAAWCVASVPIHRAAGVRTPLSDAVLVVTGPPPRPPPPPRA